MDVEEFQPTPQRQVSGPLTTQQQMEKQKLISL